MFASLLLTLKLKSSIIPFRPDWPPPDLPNIIQPTAPLSQNPSDPKYAPKFWSSASRQPSQSSTRLSSRTKLPTLRMPSPRSTMSLGRSFALATSWVLLGGTHEKCVHHLRGGWAKLAVSIPSRRISSLAPGTEFILGCSVTALGPETSLQRPEFGESWPF